jgi:hypothetical protein
MCDRRRDLRSIARKVGISFGSAQAILTEVYGISKVSAMWVPRMTTRNGPGLTFLLSRYENEPDFIYRIVTQDETWVIHFDPE